MGRDFVSHKGVLEGWLRSSVVSSSLSWLSEEKGVLWMEAGETNRTNVECHRMLVSNK
jgi:hypothetical protein